jgi:hypothetical protein
MPGAQTIQPRFALSGSRQKITAAKRIVGNATKASPIAPLPMEPIILPMEPNISPRGSIDAVGEPKE